MKLIEFDSYQKYVKAQQRKVKRRSPGPFHTDIEMRLISAWLKGRSIDGRIEGICHGARDGVEVAQFQKDFPEAKIFGTDLFPYTGGLAEKFGNPSVVKWNFSKRNKDWTNRFDLVYSNSLDHARDPIATLKTWFDQLNPSGFLFVQWGPGRDLVHTGDCFGATLWEYVELLDEFGLMVDLIYVKVKKNTRRRMRRHGDHVAVLAARKKNEK